MKNKIMFVLFILCALFFVGCGNADKPDDGDKPVEPDVNENKIDEVFAEVTKDINEKVPYFVLEDVDFPIDYPELNAYVEWSSSDRNIINSDGYVTVDRLKAKEVTLTYQVYVGDEVKEGTKNVIVTPVTIDKVAERFEKQIKPIITRDYKIETTFYGLYTIDWTSSNTEVFDNEGIYHKPLNDTEITINYTINCKEYTSESRSKKATVTGYSDLEKLEEVSSWLKRDVVVDLYLTEGVNFPSEYKKYNIPIAWRSTNPDVVNIDGTIHHFVYERYVTLIAFFELPNGSSGSEKFDCVVSPLDTSKMTKTEILENVVESIARTEYAQVKFGYSECPRLSTTYGHLYFYLNNTYPVTKMLIPTTEETRPGTIMTPKIVVIHDTANYGASAKQNATFCKNGGGGNVSWHYTVGNDGIYQTLPENEVGWHANGSGSQKFTMIDSGVKATVKRPQSFVGDDGYVYINNQKSRIKVPDVNHKYADYGFIIEIGSNGNYYINDSFYCTSNSRNAVKGGNGSGIGIETSVQQGTDYLLTMRMLAKHVADILIRYNMNLDHVVQHNTTSGKNCPQAIREANFWYTLKDYINLEMFLKVNFPNVQFAWKSTSPIMDDTGAIALDLQNYSTVTYNVVVSENGQKLINKSYTTKLI